MTAKKLPFVTRIRYENKDEYYEENLEPSTTVQGQSMEVSELMEKHIQGTLNMQLLNREGYYEDEGNDIDMEKLRYKDFVEIDILKEKAETALTKYHQALKGADKELKEDKKAEDKSVSETKAKSEDDKSSKSSKEGEKPE